MSITKLHNGAWQVSDISAGYRICRTYYFLTRREAIAAFRRDVWGPKAGGSRD